MPRIPLPRRSLKSLCILVVLPLLGVIIVVSSYDFVAAPQGGASGAYVPLHAARRPLAESRPGGIPSIDDYEFDEPDDDWSPREERGGQAAFAVRAGQGAAGGLGGMVAKGAQVVVGARQAVFGGRLGGKAARADATGSESASESASGSSAGTKARPRSKGAPHPIGEDGLLRINPAGRHPVWELIEKAREEWEARKARQSRTLEQAVKTYQARYGRNPPKGFDRWWEYAQDNNVQMVDEYDQIVSGPWACVAVAPFPPLTSAPPPVQGPGAVPRPPPADPAQPPVHLGDHSRDIRPLLPLGGTAVQARARARKGPARPAQAVRAAPGRRVLPCADVVGRRDGRGRDGPREVGSAARAAR